MNCLCCWCLPQMPARMYVNLPKITPMHRCLHATLYRPRAVQLVKLTMFCGADNTTSTHLASQSLQLALFVTAADPQQQRGWRRHH